MLKRLKAKLYIGSLIAKKFTLSLLESLVEILILNLTD